jgi:hypothetical protein
MFAEPSFQRTLAKLSACPEAVEWVGDRTMAQAWAECERADWMLWLLAKLDGCYSPRLRLAACACARTALQYVPDGEDRPRLAIECAERFARGEATDAELRAAGAAAEAAAWAAGDAARAATEAAAEAAAWAAWAAGAAEAATWAATGVADAAAGAAAWAAWAAGDAAGAARAAARAAGDAAGDAAYREMADLIRATVAVPK